jgi:hypothetical protein
MALSAFSFFKSMIFITHYAVSKQNDDLFLDILLSLIQLKHGKPLQTPNYEHLPYSPLNYDKFQHSPKKYSWATNSVLLLNGE